MKSIKLDFNFKFCEQSVSIIVYTKRKLGCLQLSVT